MSAIVAPLPHSSSPAAAQPTTGAAALAKAVAVTTGDGAALVAPAAAADCWRPTMDDVDRISWGRNAKKKGTGSRGVPHRLNDDERSLYDIARRKGFVEIGGSGWRRQRSDRTTRSRVLAELRDISDGSRFR